MSRRKGNFRILSVYDAFSPKPGEIVSLLLWFIVGSVLGMVVTAVLTAVGGQGFATEYGTLIAYPLMFVPPMMYASFKSRCNCFCEDTVAIDSCHFGSWKTWVAAVAASVAVIAAGFMCDALNSLMPPMPEWLEEALNGMVDGKLWVSLLCVSVMAPFCEEWMCRGMILRGLLQRTRMHPAWAICISSLVFALIHANPWQAIPAFVLGCLMGYVYYKTGSLRLTMLMHCVNNTVAVFAGRIDAFKDADNWCDVLNPGTYWLLFACGALILALLVNRVKNQKPDWWRSTKSEA